MGATNFYRVGLAAIVAGSVALVVAVVLVVHAVTGGFGLHGYRVPGSWQRTLSSGDYALYEKVGATTGLGNLSFGTNRAADLGPSEVDIIGPDGPVAVSGLNGSLTLTVGSSRYDAFAQFHAGRSGGYDFAVNSPYGSRLVSVGPTLGGAVRQLGPGLATGVAGMLLVAGGVVTAIVAHGRRRRRLAGGPYPAGGPSPGPGWWGQPVPDWARQAGPPYGAANSPPGGAPTGPPGSPPYWSPPGPAQKGFGWGPPAAPPPSGDRPGPAPAEWGPPALPAPPPDRDDRE